MSKEVKPYSYFDTPDGEDIAQKLWYVLKPATIFGLGWATMDVMLYSHPKGYFQTLGRYAYIAAPAIGMASSFVLATNAAANIRKKDDKLNWVIGGCAAGSVFGIWRKSTIRGFGACAVFSLAALVKKSALQYGWVLIPDKFNAVNGGVSSVRQDWSLMQERPRNWTTKAE